MKLEFVLPLLGETGGAERALAGLGRQIVASSDWEVTIQTTCATSAATWANAEPAGITQQDRLTVHRHHVDSGRTSAWRELERAVDNTPKFITEAKAQEYLVAQGPVSSSLADCLAGSDADLALHMPYPYWTTLALAPRQQKPTLIWPAAHDEPGLRLPTVRSALCAVDGLVFSSEASRRLTESTHPVAHKRQMVLGVGVQDMPDATAQAAAQTIGIDDGRPWIVCVGRMLPGKGTHTLAQLWANYVRQHKPEHRLVFAGEPSLKIKTDNHTVIAGEVDEKTKWGLIRGADVLIHPGRLESFGIVLLEAWATSTPVLVNAYCPATSDHVKDSGGGAMFRDQGSFTAALKNMLTNHELREQLATNGNNHWRNKYTWHKITPRFMNFCQQIQKFHKPAKPAA